MKTSTRLLHFVAAIFVSSSLSFAAQTTINFETVGHNWTWTTFEVAPAWSIVANPSIGGINTSAQVGKIVLSPNDKPWGGIQCEHGDFGPLTVSATSNIVKIMVYKDVISPVGIKFEDITGGSKGELKVSNTKINQWEELTFDFSSQIDPGMTFSRIVIFPDFPTTRSAGSTTYIDNIVYVRDDVAADTNPPTLFTASATDITSTGLTLKLKATDNSGIVRFTVTEGTNVYSKAAKSNVETTLAISGLTANTSYNFSVVCKDPSNNGAANNPLVVPATTTAAIANPPVPTQPAANVKSVYSDTYTNIPNTLQDWYGNAFSTVTNAGNNMLKNTSSCCMGYDFNSLAIDMSAMTKLHVDIYPVSLSSVDIGLVSTVEVKKSYALTLGQWNSLNIPLTDFAGTLLTGVKQVGFWNMNGTFYLDNLYFYNETSSGLDQVGVENKLSCYPNPTRANLTVSSASEISDLYVNNLVGQELKSVQVKEKNATINLSDLPAGQYFIIAKLANGQIVTQKIAKL